MRSFVSSVTRLALVLVAVSAVACGPGEEKPPLTPDPADHGLDDAGAPGAPATPNAPTPPK